MKTFGIVCVALVLVLVGCTQNVTNIDWTVQESEFGTVKISVEIVSAKEVAAKGLADATTLVVVMSCADYPNRVVTVDISSGLGTAQIDSVRPGAWTITAHLEDASGAILYRGTKALTVISGHTYNIRMLLEATSGVGIGFDLLLEQALSDNHAGISYMDYPSDIRVSPDGKNIYVTSYNEDALLVFDRDTTTGLITYADQTFVDGQGQAAKIAGWLSLAIDPAGENVYVVSNYDDALTTFIRNPSTGALTYVGEIVNGVDITNGLDGASAIVVSPDGKSVYVASRGTYDYLTVFDRDSASQGALTFDTALEFNTGSLAGIDEPRGLALSADNKSLYVAAGEGYYADEGYVVVFDRVPDGASVGDLTFNSAVTMAGDGIPALWGAMTPVVSPDDQFVYIASQSYNYGDSHLVVFSRNTTDGTLSFVESHATGYGTYGGIAAMAADGSQIFVAASDTGAKESSVWNRDAGTGRLTFAYTIPMACERIIPEGASHIYAINPGDDSLLFLTPNPTGS